jgi:hypothetical protein
VQTFLALSVPEFCATRFVTAMSLKVALLHAIQSFGQFLKVVQQNMWRKTYLQSSVARGEKELQDQFMVFLTHSPSHHKTMNHISPSPRLRQRFQGDLDGRPEMLATNL